MVGEEPLVLRVSWASWQVPLGSRSLGTEEAYHAVKPHSPPAKVKVRVVMVCI